MLIVDRPGVQPPLVKSTDGIVHRRYRTGIADYLCWAWWPLCEAFRLGPDDTWAEHQLQQLEQGTVTCLECLVRVTEEDH